MPASAQKRGSTATATGTRTRLIVIVAAVVVVALIVASQDATVLADTLASFGP